MARLISSKFRKGVSVFTTYDVNDPASPRVRRALPRFRVAQIPNPDNGDWAAWETLLADRTRAKSDDYSSAINLDNGAGFATLSSSLIALPADPGRHPVWRFAAGPPDKPDFIPVRFVETPGSLDFRYRRTPPSRISREAASLIVFN